MEHVVKMDETGITDLMLQIEAEYERKYGDNVLSKCTFALEVLVYMTLGWTLFGTLFIFGTL
jgi:hypothetical protein